MGTPFKPGDKVRDNATASVGVVELRSDYSVGPVLSLRDGNNYRWRAKEADCDLWDPLPHTAPCPIFAAGCDAYWNGHPRAANPYPADLEKWQTWDDGWDEGLCQDNKGKAK